jgi:flagellar hook-length control protein FliK
MSASLSAIVGPLAQTGSTSAEVASARTSGRSAALAFNDRLEAALGQPAGVSPDVRLAMQAPAGTLAAAAPTAIAEPGAFLTTAPTTSVALNPLAVLPGAPAAPPADGTSPTTIAKPDDSGAELADVSARTPGKPAASMGRAGRAAAAERSADNDAAVIDPAAPVGTASLDPTPPPTSIVLPTRADGASGTGHPAHVASDHPAPAAASRNGGPNRIEHGPAPATASQEQTPAASGAEAPLAAEDATPTRSSAAAATDPTKAAIPVGHELPSAEAIARAMAEASQPAATPVGRASPAVQPTMQPSRTTEIASPAQQLAAPLVVLGTGPDQSRRMTVRLDPEALGAVQVRVDRPKDGPARVEITVERTETLSLLLRDQPQLHRALDQAGIPAEGRTVVFQVAAPDPQPRNDTFLPDHRHSNGGQPATGDNGARSEGYGGGSDGGGSGRSRRDRADEDGSLYRFTPSAAQHRLRDGLDITA